MRCRRSDAWLSPRLRAACIVPFPRVLGLLGTLVALAVLATACSAGGGASATPAPTARSTGPGSSATAGAEAPAPTGKVSVFAAASLTDVFTQIAHVFESTYPGTAVELNFAGSSALATQIEQAAPADVFASANADQMQRLIDGDLIAGHAPQLFALNAPVIVVPVDSRAGVASAADLAKPGLRLVLALADVPIGRYAREVIHNLAADPANGEDFEARALANVVSNEEDVRAVLAKVELGEADAGVVYRTDAAVSGGRVRVIDIPGTANVVAEYPIAVTADAAHPDAAAAFVAFVLSDNGRQLLANAGFDPAP